MFSLRQLQSVYGGRLLGRYKHLTQFLKYGKL